MITIYKYPLQLQDVQSFTPPKEAIILDIFNQDQSIFLWALVDTDKPLDSRAIYVFGTGRPIPKHLNLKHLKTLHMFPFVWHFFEETA